MKVTIFVETNEAQVLGIGFRGEPEFNYGVEVDLPSSELVAFVKARDAWLKAHERLSMIHSAKLKRISGARRRIRKINGRLRKLKMQRESMPSPSANLNRKGIYGDVCKSSFNE